MDNLSTRCRQAILIVALMLVGSGAAVGQNNRFTERSFVPSPALLGMGDAGVALIGDERHFFYNPAQLPQTTSHFTVIGVQAAASRDLTDQIRFFNRRIQPAIESEFDLDANTLEQLYRDANRLGQNPIRGHGAVVLPSFVYSTNGVGLGGGLFAKTAVNYRVRDAGLGVPEVYLLSRTDVMAVASLGLDLGTIDLQGAKVGVTGTRTRRFLAFENKPLDTFAEDETAILLEGNTFQIDVGALYSPQWSIPGHVTFGGAVYDLLDQRYDYAFGGAPRIPFLEGIIAESATVDAGTADEEVERARERFRLQTSYRVGVAYHVVSASFLNDVRFAVDYAGYGHQEQNVLARIHVGGEAMLGEAVAVRGGLSAGYPTGGLGVHLGSLELDYAYHAFEEGRAPGQLETYVHTVRLAVRIH